MNHLLRVRLPRALAVSIAVMASLALPTLAKADIPISAFAAGPVATYNDNTNFSGFPATSTTSGFPANTFDTGCAYGTPGAPVNTSGPLSLTLSTQAGATTDYCVAFRLTPGSAITGEDINNSLVQLPVGTAAQIDLASKCTLEQFARDAATVNTCPATSQVGTAISQINIGDAQTRDAPGRIYALSTPGDKAGLLGVALLTSGTTESKYFITVSQLGDPAVGLQNQTDTLAKTVSGLPVAINANALRFWGPAAGHTHLTNPFAVSAPTKMAADFMRVGTTCQTDQVVKLTVNPYTDTAGNANSQPTTASTSYKLTGCDSLGFSPTFSSSISGETQVGGHPQLDVSITSPEGDEDLGGTKITLPSGIATDLANIQNTCTQAAFAAATCPDAAKVGSVKANLSGVDAGVATGDVYLVKVDGYQLPGLGLNFKGRLPLRVVGTTQTDAQGRLVSTFAGLPSIPERSLDITLNGGSKGILVVSPGLCKASAYDATLTGQNGKTKSFSIATSCPDQFSATLSNSTKTRPVLLLGSSAATGKKIKSLRVGLPKGLRFDSKNLRKAAKVTYASNGFDDGVKTADIKVAKLKATAKFTFPGTGSNGFSILTHTGVIRSTSAFAKSTSTVYVEFHVVYQDGSKATKYVAVKRAG